MYEVSDGAEQQHAGRHGEDVEDGEAGQAHPHRGQGHSRPRVAHPGTHAVYLLAISEKIYMSNYKLSLVQEKCIRFSSPLSSPPRPCDQCSPPLSPCCPAPSASSLEHSSSH